MVFRMSVGGTAINSYGNAKNQAFLNGAFPDGMIKFGGKELPGKDHQCGDNYTMMNRHKSLNVRI